MLFFLSFMTLFPHLCFSDSLLLKNGRRIEGVIEAQYEDQILFTNINGQEYIKRIAITDLKTDPPLQNYYFKATFYENNKNYRKSLDYFQLILRQHPHEKKALEGLTRVSEKIYQTSGYKTKNYVRSMNILKNDKIKKKKATDFFNQLGVRVKKKRDSFTVLSIFPGSWSEKKSLHPQDQIIRINENNIQKWPIKQLMEYINKNTISSITIKRTVMLPTYKKTFWGQKKEIPIRFKKKLDAFVVTKVNSVSSHIGLQVGDQLTAIENQDSHYLKKKHIQQFMQQKDYLKVELLRKISLSMK